MSFWNRKKRTHPRRLLRRHERPARRLLRNRQRLMNLLLVATQKAIQNREALREGLREFALAIRMLYKWARREYTQIPWRTLVALTAALLYFVNPFDLVPDMLLMMGYIDDIAVMNFVMRAVHRDVQRFLEWENRNLLATGNLPRPSTVRS